VLVLLTNLNQLRAIVPQNRALGFARHTPARKRRSAARIRRSITIWLLRRDAVQMPPRGVAATSANTQPAQTDTELLETLESASTELHTCLSCAFIFRATGAPARGSDDYEGSVPVTG
jgi:hypothetical protein